MSQQGGTARDLLVRLFDPLLDAMYPPKCALCDTLGPRGLCSVCADEMVPRQTPVLRIEDRGPISLSASFFHYDGRAAQAVRRLKYERATSLAAPLSEMLYECLVQHGLLDVDVVVPVPIHWRRRFWRGFNQSDLLCSRFLGVPVDRTLLTRIRPTRPQVGLNQEQRQRNIAGAFRARGVEGLSVMLVDDVMTSGQTVRECAKALKGAGASWVGACAFAGP